MILLQDLAKRNGTEGAFTDPYSEDIVKYRPNHS